MDVKKNFVLPIVFHRITKSQKIRFFDDLRKDDFDSIIETISEKTVRVNGASFETIPGKLNYLITFDDGYSSDFTLAWPTLQKHNIQAISFVVPGKVGKTGFVSKGQLKQMVGTNMIIGSHSMTHRNLLGLNYKDALEELTSSKKWLEDLTSAPINFFSFPFGKFNTGLCEMAFEAGYKKVFISQHGIVNPNQKKVNRNSINSSMGWRRIQNTLECKPQTRFSWVVEDNLKAGLKRVLGDSAYRTVRNFLSKKT